MQDQLIVVVVQKHRVVILQRIIVIPVLLPMVLLVLLHVVILQLRQVAVALGVVIRAVVLLLDHHQVEVPLVVAVPFKSFPVSLAPSYIVCAIPQGAIISIPRAIKTLIFFILVKPFN